MKIKRVDVAVIGAGTAGLIARREAEKQGVSTVLIGTEPHGTTCARTGCMPSKLLIAAAEAAHQAKHASIFGIKTEIQIDGRAVMERVQKERDRFVRSVLPVIDDLSKKGLFIKGHARFLNTHRLRIGNEWEVEAKSFVLAVGSRPRIPKPFESFSELIWTHENFFELEHLPRSVLIVGTGSIGLELGQALQRLGVRTVITGIDNKIGPFDDPLLLEEAKRIFSSKLELYPNYKLNTLEKGKNGFEILFEDQNQRKHRMMFDHVLMAAGSKSNLDHLGLDSAGIPLSNGLPQFDPETMQIGNSHFFVAGDADGYRVVLHEAADEGHIAGKNAALFPHVTKRPRKTRLVIVFTDPQMAVIGSGWSGKTNGVPTGEVNYSKQGRAQVMAVNEGLARLYGNAETACLTGAEMIGPSVEHLAHLITLAVQNQIPVPQFLALPFYHPTLEEGIETALEKLNAAMCSREFVTKRLDEYGPGC